MACGVFQGACHLAEYASKFRQFGKQRTRQRRQRSDGGRSMEMSREFVAVQLEMDSASSRAY